MNPGEKKKAMKDHLDFIETNWFDFTQLEVEELLHETITWIRTTVKARIEAIKMSDIDFAEKVNK